MSGDGKPFFGPGLTPEARERGLETQQKKARIKNLGPTIIAVEPAPYSEYLEVEIIIRSRDGQERNPMPDGTMAGRIVGRCVRTISTLHGRVGETERRRLSNHLTAFVRYALQRRVNAPIEQTIQEAKDGMR